MKRKITWLLLCFVLLFLVACGEKKDEAKKQEQQQEQVVEEDDLVPASPEEITQKKKFQVPEYTGDLYVVIDENKPWFTEADMTAVSYEYFSELDHLGRCGVVEASIGTDLMPTEERGKIGQVKPSGWKTVKYDCVDGMYLFNRCHLIGYQLTGENANLSNLITGTRYMNVQGMLPFENMVADYVKETNNHVMYRVTPIFEGDNLVATGVQMEAKSVEDHGKGIQFHVFVFNVQPGIAIDYSNGNSWEVAETEPEQEPVPENPESVVYNYVLNKNTKKFHHPDCESVDAMKEKNKEYYEGTRDAVIERGFEPCGNCKP